MSFPSEHTVKQCCINTLKVSLKSIYLPVIPKIFVSSPQQSYVTHCFHGRTLLFYFFPRCHVNLKKKSNHVLTNPWTYSSVCRFLPLHVQNLFSLTSFLFYFIFPSFKIFPDRKLQDPVTPRCVFRVHWAAQIRPLCFDVGLLSESGSVCGCRDPAGSSPGKPQLSGVFLLIADNNSHFPLVALTAPGKEYRWCSLYVQRTNIWFCFPVFSQ